MLSIHKDLVVYVGEYLSNREKVALSSICKKMNLLKCSFIYHDEVHARAIQNISYKQNFKHITCMTRSIPIPTIQHI